MIPADNKRTNQIQPATERSVTELGQGINPDTAIIKNCPKCGRLNWSWTLCDHKARTVRPKPE